MVHLDLDRPLADRRYSIEEAAKLTGTSPATLRMWELRHGWPRALRRQNGYRCYSALQVAEIGRLVRLLATGKRIGELVQHGVPLWPAAGSHAPTRADDLAAARTLPMPTRAGGRALREQVIAALADGDAGRLHELVQRCPLEAHPLDQPWAVWLPCLAGMAALQRHGRAVPDARGIAAGIEEQSRAALLRMRVDGPMVTVIPATCADAPLAAVVALVLAHAGVAARPAGRAVAGPAVAVATTADAAAPAGVRALYRLIDQPTIADLTAEAPRLRTELQECVHAVA